MECFAEAKPLFAARDRGGLVALSLRTWAAASPDQAARAQIRAAGEIRGPAVVVTGDLEYPMVVAAPGADHLPPLRAPDLIAGLVSELESR